MAWSIVAVIPAVALGLMVLNGIASDNSELAALGVAGIFLFLWPLCWALWTMGKFAFQSMREAWIRECDHLAVARGCEDPLCARCYRG